MDIRTMHPQVNGILELLEKEVSHFRRIHRLIDLCEVLIKTHTSYILSDYFSVKDISDDIKELLAYVLIIPSLGSWQKIGRVVINDLAVPKAIAKDEFENLEELLLKKQKSKLLEIVKSIYSLSGETYTLKDGVNYDVKNDIRKDCFNLNGYANSTSLFIKDFYRTFNWWDEKVEVNKLVDFRNRYAHGATPLEEDCQREFKNYWNIIKNILKSRNMAWLFDTSVVVFKLEGEKLIPAHFDDESYSFLTEEKLEKIFAQNENIKENRPYLINEEGQLLELFPFLYYKKHDKTGKDTIIFYNDLKHKDKKEISYLNYSYGDHIKEKEIYKEFMDIIKIEEWKKQFKISFDERIEKLTNVFEGRERELDEITTFLQKRDKGFCFITGAPGIGKSSLVAKLIKNLKKEADVPVIEYLIKRGNGNSSDILKYLNYKLEEIFKTGLSIDEKNLKTSLDARLSNISKNLSGKKLVIIIDGLDEGLKEDKEILSNLIYESYKDIYVIYSSRMSNEIKKFYHYLDREEKFQMELGGLSSTEIRSLLYEVINKYELEDSYVEEVKKKSEGNPLYVKLLCKALDSGEMKVNDSISLTSSINGFYQGIIDRYLEMDNGQWILKILSIITCAKQFVSEKFIKLVMNYGYGKGEEEVPRALNELMEVLITNPSRNDEYQLFHESFREYLVYAKRDEIIEGEKAIVSFCDNYCDLSDFSESISMYPFKFYSYHLRKLKRLDSMETLCEDGFIQAQIDKTNSYTYSLNFLKDAVNLAIEKKDMNRVVKFTSLMGKLYIKLNNAVLNLVGKDFIAIEEIEKALMEVELTDGVKQDVIYFNLLVKALEDKDSEVKKEKIKLILDHMENREKVGNWCRIIPLPFMVGILRKIKELSLDISPILKWGRLQDDDEDNEYVNRIFDDFDLSKNTDCRLLFDLKEIMGDDKIKYLCLFAKTLHKQGQKDWGLWVLKYAIAQVSKIDEPTFYGAKGSFRSELYGICAEAAVFLNETELVQYVQNKINFLQSDLDTYLNLARTNATLGNIEECKNNLQDALKTAYKIREHDNSIVKCIINICNLAKDIEFEDFRKSCEEEALALAQEDRTGIDYEMLMEYFIRTGRIDKGLDMLKSGCVDYRVVSQSTVELLLNINEIELVEKVIQAQEGSLYVSYIAKQIKYYFKNDNIEKVMQLINLLNFNYITDDGEIYDSERASGYEILCKEYIKNNQVNKAREIYLVEKLNSPSSMARYLASKGYEKEALEMIAILKLENSIDVNFYKILSYSAFKRGDKKAALVYINSSLRPVEFLGLRERERNKVIYIYLHRIRKLIRSGKLSIAFEESKSLSEYCKNTYSYPWDSYTYNFNYILDLTRKLEEETDSEELLKNVEKAIDAYKYNIMFYSLRQGALERFALGHYDELIEDLEKVENIQEEITAIEGLVYCSTGFHNRGDFYNRDRIINFLLKLYDEDKMYLVDSIFCGLFHEVKLQGNYKYEKRIEEILIKEQLGKKKDGSNLIDESCYLMRLGEQTTLLRLLKECDFKGKELCNNFEIISMFLNHDNLNEIKNYVQENNFMLGKEGKKAILGAILDNLFLVDNYEDELYKIISELINDEQGVEKIIKNFILHQYYYFIDDRTELVKVTEDLKEVIWIDDLILKEDKKYDYDNLIQWIKEIEDKEKQSQILALANNVLLQIISKDEFNEKVKELL